MTVNQCSGKKNVVCQYFEVLFVFNWKITALSYMDTNHLYQKGHIAVFQNIYTCCRLSLDEHF